MVEGLPGLDSLAQVCAEFGLNDSDARLLHHRSNAVYLLPQEQVVVRLAPATALRRERAATAITVTRWLCTQSDRIALPPVPGDQPIVAGAAVATFWPYQSSARRPSLENLAGPLRRLHVLPAPPFSMPVYKPLHRLDEALEIDSGRERPVLSADDRTWLTACAHKLQGAFASTDFPLGFGLVHADAHTENLVRHQDDWVLIDWDQACLGPRELDLLAGAPDHFHEPEMDRVAFLTAYGYNLTRWSSWTLLRDISELHSLASYIRLAAVKRAAQEELARRVRSLRSGDRSVRWRAVS
jgi:aminoglycoside phosphotransferase (APT) family kinase protein